ncbi:hypothetical protein [Neorhizobium sp. DAR64861/K0K2]
MADSKRTANRTGVLSPQRRQPASVLAAVKGSREAPIFDRP